MEEVFETVEDLMLGGLKIVQDKRLYRFTSDSILLSRFASAKKGERVADFCAGSGIVGLHYYGLHPEKVASVTLFEIQPSLCNIAKKSIEINNLGDKFSVIEGALQNADKSLNSTFSLVLCNPPYKKANSGEQNLQPHIAICRHEVEITLEQIVKTASRLLKVGGRFCICQRIERLTDLLCAMRECKIEPCNMVFVRTPNGKPYLVMCEGVKGMTPQLKIQKEMVNGE